jgi:hypothetical protein
LNSETYVSSSMILAVPAKRIYGRMRAYADQGKILDIEVRG